MVAQIRFEDDAIEIGAAVVARRLGIEPPPDCPLPVSVRRPGA